MSKKTVIIIVSVITALVVAAGLGVLIWWLLRDTEEFSIIHLEGEGFGDVKHSAAFTRIRNVGDMFWWFYPTIATSAASRPILLWLDGATGVAPSLLANFGMFGPYDFNLNRRNESWVDEYNLLFVDAPLGTGFSTPQDENQIPSTLDENADHLIYTLESFYRIHEDYANAPLYIFGQGHGAQLAVSLAIRLNEIEHFSHNLRGVVIANGIISPAVALTKLGFYLEELGYIDRNGRDAIESLSNETNTLVDAGQLEDAFDKFTSLGEFVNDNAGAVAVNLGHIVEKLTRLSSLRDYFGQSKYMSDVFPLDVSAFMRDTVAPALGIPSNVAYDGWRESALQAVRASFMKPATDKIEYILENTDLNVTIYNGNLDAVSNTPGQLEWVNNLQWEGQTQFKSSPRQTLVVNRLVEGYFRETQRLQFYWMNAAGQSVPLDSPAAMRRVLQRITNNN